MVLVQSSTTGSSVGREVSGTAMVLVQHPTPTPPLRWEGSPGTWGEDISGSAMVFVQHPTTGSSLGGEGRTGTWVEGGLEGGLGGVLMCFLAQTERLPLDANPISLARSSPLSPCCRSLRYFSTLSMLGSGMMVSVSLSLVLIRHLKTRFSENSSMIAFRLYFSGM